ncbi:thioesterase II family protein [Kitasatospora brasiliensis]|uniref:thioesterase II family protein n=1 Tax=Kitasatospora brasiliensis TaxID=3058040 RepID=UPI00292F3847|nr:alpha/beta fold hydrolase [Kitasatospora sp. K002]
MTGKNRWLLDWNPPSSARTLIVCLPHAGSGANQFRPWQELLGPRVALLAVQLPGRENRWREPPATRAAEVIDELVPELLDRLDRPYLVFGHSMGALLGYELALALGREHGRWPGHFVASASRAPHRQTPDESIAGLDDRQLVEELIADGAVPDYVARDERLIRLVTRPLRGDIALCDDYTPTPGPLRCPVDGWRGEADLGVSDHHIREWSDCSGAGASIRTYPGGHLYHLADPHPVVDGLRRLAAGLEQRPQEQPEASPNAP